MSGNICAATNSPSPCSKATTTSSTNPAPRGASSPTTPNASHQSHPELGRRSILEADGITSTQAPAGPEQSARFFERHRLAEQIALDQVETHLVRRYKVRAGLYSFGNR